VEELKRSAGNQFDPQIVEAFVLIALTPDGVAVVRDAVAKKPNQPS